MFIDGENGENFMTILGFSQYQKQKIKTRKKVQNFLKNKYYIIYIVIMNIIKFKYRYWRLKKEYKSFLKLKNKVFSERNKKTIFEKFFIRDEEDRILNKKILDDFDKKIKKGKLKLYKKENQLNKRLFSLGIIDLNYICLFNRFKIKNFEFIRDILILKIKGKK